ncbi:MAG TPA: ATP-binding cassette domain-containing protein, partial [Cellvibrionaceae bacterium]
MIEFHQVSKRYTSGQEALSRVDVQIARGEMVFLTGHSGAGKSTLMKLIMLMERPSQGQILIGGRNTSSIRRGSIAHYRRDIGVVFQNHQLLFDRSVFANVALPLQVAGFADNDIGRRVRAALDKV